jgi:hypothetical protein
MAGLKSVSRPIFPRMPFPDRSFQGNIARISPVFRTQTRQARVEVRVANPELDLKPGMFVRVGGARTGGRCPMVPETALVNRNHETGDLCGLCG